MAGPGERSIAEVLGDIVGNVQEIVRSEMRLAKAELREDVVKAKAGAILIAAAAFAGVLAAAFALLAAVRGLETVMPPWAAALVVAGATALFAGVCMAIGLKQLKTIGLPQTKATIVEDIQWAKTRSR